MKKICYIVMWLPLGAALLNSCAREPMPGEMQNPDIQPAQANLYYTPVMIDEYISDQAGSYIRQLDSTDFQIIMSSLKSTPLNPEYVYGFAGPYETCQTETKSKPELPVDVYAGGIAIHAAAAKTKSTGSNQALQQLYGTTIDYEFVPKSSTRSGAPGTPTVVSQYVPELVQITSPSVTKEDELFPVCYFKDFLLQWNADPQNTNGLIVSVHWFGKRMYGEDQDQSFVRRTAFIPEDNGECTLDPKMFNHMPNTALVYITLLRGCIDNIVVDDYSYKIMSKSHIVLPIILARKIKANDYES